MNKIKRIHMMGIGGSGMSGVSYLASKMGYEVTGCDLESETSYAKNIFKGHDPEHLKGMDLLVVSPAVYYQNKNNPELLEGEKRKIAITWQEFLGKYLAKNKKVICVAGTHGKSTTAAMAGKLLFDADMDPSVVVGAKIPQWNENARYGKSEYFVIEADEFNDNFLNYSPEILILNNIEFDHPDYFESENAVFDSFKKFISNMTGQKILIYNADSPGAEKLLSIIGKSDIKPIPYSLKDPEIKLALQVPGKYNLSNAFGVVKLGKILGIGENLIKESLEDFSGIGRRVELIGEIKGIKVYDDYAHHPTAIKVTLDGLREKYPEDKILVVDEPHGYRRTKALLPMYKGVFDSADKVIIGPIFKARDEIDASISPEKIAEASGHKNISIYDNFDDLIKNLKLGVKNYNVIVVMGAGKSYQWAREVLNLI